MPEWIARHQAGITTEALSEAIFLGQVLVFERLHPMQDLIAAARGLIERAFATSEPVRAHRDIAPDTYRARYIELRQAFLRDDTIRDAFEAALLAAGVDGHATYRDRLVLRIAPPGVRGYRRGFGIVPPHRDSWGAGLTCQINWWLPIYPVNENRTLAIYPVHWTTPIANDAEGWDWRKAGSAPDVPLLPTAQAPPDKSGEIRLVVEPGALVAFSAAHLHASVPNTTPEARFSMETRTVALADFASGRGAPDIDGGSVPPALEWFRRLRGGDKLSDAMARA
ncbi:MAG: hypothetical protein ACR2PO_09130 [Methyloligellaceae bacterium]